MNLIKIFIIGIPSFHATIPPQLPICCSIYVFKLYHKTCEQFYRNFGLYEKRPNSFLPGLSRSIINQFRFHNFLCLCLASVHLPYPFHLVSAFSFSVTPFRFASSGTISSMRFRAASSILAQYCLTYTQLSRSVLCFFSSRKEIVLLSFLSRKKRKQKKVICGTVVSLRFRRFRQRAAQNGRFTYEPSVFSVPGRTCEKVSYLRITSSPAVSFVSFLQEKKTYPFRRKEIVPFQKKRNRSLSEEKNRPSITSTARRGSRQQPSCPRPLRGSRLQRRSQRLRPHTRTACSSCRSPHRQ